MKRITSVLLVILMLSLCGCSLLPADSSKDVIEILKDTDTIETLKGWSFQYNEGTNDYSLFFGLLNDKYTYIAADVDVDIRIVNDEDEEVYSATKTVTAKDFGNYESQAAGKQYLANVRIPASDIKNGKSNNGTVYLTVYKGNEVRFDEVNCSALYCLPVADVQLNVQDLPVELEVKEYDGSVESIISVTDVTYDYEKGIFSQLKITISGQKTYGNSSGYGYDIISYKLYDSSGYLVESGNVYLKSLSAGDKFKEDSIIYDVTPGETYSLQLTEYSW